MALVDQSEPDRDGLKSVVSQLTGDEKASEVMGVPVTIERSLGHAIPLRRDPSLAPEIHRRSNPPIGERGGDIADMGVSRNRNIRLVVGDGQSRLTEEGPEVTVIGSDEVGLTLVVLAEGVVGGRRPSEC